MADDFLDGLVRSTRQKAKKDDNAPSPVSSQPAEKSTGLNPLDLLGLPAEQRAIVNWLGRRKQASFEQIQEAVKADPEQVRGTLATLADSGYINASLSDGVIQYRVVFSGKITRSGRGLPSDIWSAIDLDNNAWLKSQPLFRDLPEAELQEMARKLEARRYHRDEVVLWQGHISEYIFFIKSGMVGITRLSPQSTEKKFLAYLKQGDILGEYSMLSEQNRTASATATALSEVELILMHKADFLALMQRHASIGLELSKTLVERLLHGNDRAGRTSHAKLCLVLGVVPGSGRTSIATALALTLASVTQKTTVYTEYPHEHNVELLFNFKPDSEIAPQPGGFDAFIPRDIAALPSTVQTTFVLDQLSSHYTHIVVALPGEIDEHVTYLIERADQVVLVGLPDDENWSKLEQLSTALRPLVHPERASIFTIANRPHSAYATLLTPASADFDIPYLPEMPQIQELDYTSLPEELSQVTYSLTDRLGRTNQVSVYIPTTIQVDQGINTMSYVEETLAFMGKLFGGATTSQARGVWNSSEAGLVTEAIHIVRSFTTQGDLDKHLPDILDFLERLKKELKQEAMALEINQKFMLV